MKTRTVTLPLPRRIIGEKAGTSRSGGSQDVHVIEDVPIPVRDVPAAEAPEVLRLGERSWHVHDGRLYAPLFQEVSGPEPDAVARTMRQMATMTLPPRFDDKHRSWEKVVEYRTASGHRPDYVDAGKLRMRSVEDHGLAARDAEATRLAASLILVEGRLMHPVPAPYVLVGPRRSGVAGGGFEVAAVPQGPYADRFTTPDELFVPLPGRTRPAPAVPMGEATPWLAFEAWRTSEARSFASALAASGSLGSSARAAEDEAGFEVLDRTALEAACPPRDLADYARAAGAAYMRALSPSLHLRSDETLHALMAARSAAASARDGTPSAAEAMERFRTLGALVDAEAVESDGPRAAAALAATAQEILLRYDEYERPRAGLDPIHGGDIGDLVGLAR